MFGLFKKDPIKKLEKEYKILSAKARAAQRPGSLRENARLTAEAEALREKIEAMKEARGDYDHIK